MDRCFQLIHMESSDDQKVAVNLFWRKILMAN